MSEKETKIDREQYKTRLLMKLMGHVGQSGAIGMGELYEQVFDAPWTHRINDTRELRALITDLRRDGVPICSSSSCTGGGYWVSSAGSELNGYCNGLRKKALKLLNIEARLRKLTLPELMGQLALEDLG